MASSTTIYSGKPEDLALITRAHMYVVLEYIKLGFWELDPSNGVLSSTSTYKRNLGVPADESFDYMDFLELIVPEDLEMMQDELQMALSGEKSSYHAEYRINRADGEVRWMMSDGLVVKDGEETKRVIGTTIDVTDLKFTGLNCSIIPNATKGEN